MTPPPPVNEPTDFQKHQLGLILRHSARRREITGIGSPANRRERRALGITASRGRGAWRRSLLPRHELSWAGVEYCRMVLEAAA